MKLKIKQLPRLAAGLSVPIPVSAEPPKSDAAERKAACEGKIREVLMFYRCSIEAVVVIGPNGIQRVNEVIALP